MIPPLDTRHCLYCNAEAVVVSSIRFPTTELCRLACGHTISVTTGFRPVTPRYLRRADERECPRSGVEEGSDHVFKNLGTTTTCPACDMEFRAYTKSVYTSICPICRNDFGIRTPDDAQALIDMLDKMPRDDRAQMRAATKAGGKCILPLQGGQRVLPAPKPDPARVAAGIRSLTAYGLTTPLPESMPQLTSYVIAKNGLFEVRDTSIARICLPFWPADSKEKPRDVLGLTDELHAGVQLKIPLIPYDFLTQTVAFFRNVCDEAKGSSEAIVRIWWNIPEARYEIRVPEGDQQVSGGSVRHNDDFNLDDMRDAEGRSIWLHVADIHSHGSSMAAFWSSTDDCDERKAPEGRMFGVLGKVAQPMPDWKWRMRTREGFIELNVVDVFDLANVPVVPFTVTMENILRVAAQPDAVKDGWLSLKCPVDPFKDAIFPQAWMQQVRLSSGYGHQAPFRGGCGRVSGERLVGQYIYVKDSKGRLEEFEYDGSVSKPTGHYLELGK